MALCTLFTKCNDKIRSTVTRLLMFFLERPATKHLKRRPSATTNGQT